MSLLAEQNLTIKLDSNIIIDNSKLIINIDSRIALIGVNGCGKTTLLNYIYDNPSLATFNRYLVNQHIKYDSEDQTVLDFMLKTNNEMYQIHLQILQIENDNLTTITHNYDDVLFTEYDKYLSNCKQILSGLSISNYNQLVSTFSGGNLMKLSIGRSLLICPDILMMDEPTNHLDLNAIIWLGEHLNSYKKCLIITSHQIDFINSFSNQIFYIGAPDYRLPKLYIMNGSYANYEKTIKQINKNAESAYEKLEKQIKEMRAKSKSKLEIEQFIKKADCPRPPKKYEIKINLPEIDYFTSADVIRFDNVDFAYENDNKQIFKNFDFGISLDDRLVIVGPNGIGKTTFFKLCMEQIKPTNGTIIINSNIKIGYYNQQIIHNLPLNYTPIEYIQHLDHTISIEAARKILSKVGIYKTDINDHCQTKINNLSGGQKARVSFCGLQVKKPNIILLDEPTNHLDIETIEGLINGINDYQGGIIMITHDIHFINSINSIKIIKMSNCKFNILANGLDDYI